LLNELVNVKGILRVDVENGFLMSCELVVHDVHFGEEEGRRVNSLQATANETVVADREIAHGGHHVHLEYARSRNARMVENRLLTVPQEDVHAYIPVDGRPRRRRKVAAAGNEQA